MSTAKLVVGGLYPGSPEMFVSFPFQEITLTSVYLSEDIKVDDLETMFRSWSKLESLTTLWPSPGGSMNRGSKIWVLLHLKDIAINITRSPFLILGKIGNDSDLLEDLPSLAERDDTIVAKNLSKEAVFTGRPSVSRDYECLKRLATSSKEQLASNDPHNEGLNSRWYATLFNPLFAEKGEMRIFFIGGELSYIVCTRHLESRSYFAPVSGVTPLEDHE
jgi:hypothetical protein